ncbi:MAG: hypothetical protein MK193_08420 [Lentisphaeria bacterium]|nr:hypothetical protein [Lentisphaeria bacterium]
MKAFISDGKLFLPTRAGSFQEYKCQFAETKKEEEESRKARNGWKNTSDDFSFGSSSVWGKQSDSGIQTHFYFLNCRTYGNKIYFLITNSTITGLFLYDMETKEEKRLFHKNNFMTFGFDYSPKRNQFVMSVHQDDGAYNLHLLNEYGSFICELTGGDSVDTMPSFDGDSIVYQSAGIGRGAEGYVMAYAPIELISQDLESGQTECLKGDQDSDYLCPQISSSGTVLYIRRPYQDFHDPTPLWKRILKIILVPYYFCKTIYQFMKVIGNINNNKKPEHAVQSCGTKVITIQGHEIDCSKLKKEKDQSYSIVPETWALFDQSEEIQTGVVAFTPIEDGILYTNGSTLYTLKKGTKEKIHKQDLITGIG